jgi:alpha-amylase/alpha-mannosidase (GH57 family)
MIYLSFIYHMHQPYYKNLRTGQAELPWVRMHGIKDYLDMALLLDDVPEIHQTFNLVPSLVEQLEEHANGTLTDRFLELSYKKAEELTGEEKKFLRDHFFSADLRRIVGAHPRYYQLFLKKHDDYELSCEEYRDLQVWFNLAWFDPRFRRDDPVLRSMVQKARGFSEEDKRVVLDAQKSVLGRILPTYRRLQDEGRMEVSVTPYYHPILPLLFSSFAARDANPSTPLPSKLFSRPLDAIWHVNAAMDFYRERFGRPAFGMWPSEMSISMDVLPMFINAGLEWIVVDEGLLWKTFPKIKRDGRLLYRPYLAGRKDGAITVLFRDRFLSDLIGFEYKNWGASDAVDNFMHHLLKIHEYFKDEDAFVTVALDGENAWEYYRNDGLDFLRELYERIAQTRYIKTVTVHEHLARHPARHALPFLAPGSWIFGDFNKWMGHPAKNRAWELVAEARACVSDDAMKDPMIARQMHILEGSDWFWWFGDRNTDFDALFRTHLGNLYHFLGQTPSIDLSVPLDK